MIRIIDGQLRCTSTEARYLMAALTSSGSTRPYLAAKLPKGCGVTSVLVVTEKAAAPKPKHVPIQGAELGNVEEPKP